MNRRSRVLAIGTVACIALALGAGAAPSNAAGTGNGAAYSAGSMGGTVAPITPTVKVCPISLLGLLGTCTTGVLGAVNGLLGALLTPVTSIVNGIQAIPSSLVNAVASTGLTATQPAVQQARPNPQNDIAGVPVLPTCSTGGWSDSGAGDCYVGVPLTVPTNALLGLNVKAVGGYATADSTGYIGASVATGVSLGLLGGSLGTLGAVWSSAQCTISVTSPTCLPANGTVQASLLPSTAYPNGALQVSLANGSAPQVLSVNGSALSATNKSVVVPGVGTVGVALNGNLLGLTIPLSATQLTTLLPSLAGLSSLVSDTGTVTIGIGPGSTAGPTAGGPITSTGLTISADLSLAISLKVLGLATVDITTGSGIATPDLLNLGIAYSTATAGTAAATWVPSSAI